MFSVKIYDISNSDIAWCPGCGNFGILNELKTAFSELELSPNQVVIVSGIGQAAKMPQYVNVNMFNGLHGRTLPVATAIKLVNPSLIVIAESGDGCTYGEGGNHFIHTIRKNPNIVNIVHDNMIYGLTKGQASPTTPKGVKTTLQFDGVFVDPFNPIAVAVALNASFVARTFMGYTDLTIELIKKAIKHRGYSLIDILQPCVTFNKYNTYQWYKENTYILPEDYDPTDRKTAFEIAMDTEKLALGLIYLNESKEVYEDFQPRIELF
ncbi:ferrodoxin oxidoreductase subunit beta [Thermosipho africanus H17ap60334]|jgi:2-oxoglutarate ferredoxin oxidoreductase subunit beta|uniref:thiamine pyrophosphate-dependent enzyme n=1 Tax=Thermosipho africanus TaxID=2421 RepID=UPI00028EF606|nr:thiamine pyrophosphate-dependent enzyme [Thermosipho africanus]EKF49121.1 ferrodoxin oxidoreductase subunit beta [Thermosipho africanus H17ap60334]MDK2885797.1 2-oxoglutarate/2-oxoacid ferredoxin oxidoreductase subunit beta [Thermosipho sp. (in: thermotogales)]MDK2900822.1 2-oxoglutarate/2-oxoacid ferredoxin oxidoreductase subunit beta [Thermosipho sp. (in: thermotogales)]